MLSARCFLKSSGERAALPARWNRRGERLFSLCVEAVLYQSATALGTSARHVSFARRDVAGISRGCKAFYWRRKFQGTSLAHLHPPDGRQQGAALGTKCAWPPSIEGNLGGGKKGIFEMCCYLILQVQHGRTEMLLVTGVSCLPAHVSFHVSSMFPVSLPSPHLSTSEFFLGLTLLSSHLRLPWQARKRLQRPYALISTGLIKENNNQD